MLRMPLKLKWGKKSGRYDLSQDVYVLTIFVGDHPILQCTLTTESTAKQCMEYLSQKVDLNQVEMFGFRYQMKTNDPDKRMMRWVELEKPLRRQLERWACKPRQVQLAVLYHTPNAFTLTDQMARSYYFLLMKLDVVEGRLTVALEKYINLAAYSLQVEYGDFDASIHTVDFMQSIPLLPKHICRSAQILEDLLKRVSAVHERLRGMQPSYAALLYIVDAQQCEGYGEEYFNGKDEDSSEVKVGYSQEGVVVRGSYGAPLKHKWEDIKDIQSSKRHLNVRCVDGSVVQFTMLNNTRFNGEYASSLLTAADSAYSSSSQQLSVTNPNAVNGNQNRKSSTPALSSSVSSGNRISGDPSGRERSQTTSAILGAQQSMSKSLSKLHAIPSAIGGRRDGSLRGNGAHVAVPLCYERGDRTKKLSYELNNTRFNGEYASSLLTAADSAYSSSSQQLSVTNPNAVNGNQNRKSSTPALSSSVSSGNRISGDPSGRERSQTTSAILGAQQSMSKSLSKLHAIPSAIGVSSQQRTGSYSPLFRPPPYPDHSNDCPKLANGLAACEETPKAQYARQHHFHAQQCRNLPSEKKSQFASTVTSGSSPEIHMMGVAQRRYAPLVTHKHFAHSKGAALTTQNQMYNGHALSSPDLLSTSHSTPELISSVLNRYELAVAARELQTSGISSPCHADAPSVPYSQLIEAQPAIMPTSPVANRTFMPPSAASGCRKASVEASTSSHATGLASCGLRSAQNVECGLWREGCIASAPPNSGHDRIDCITTSSASYHAQAGHVYYPQSCAHPAQPPPPTSNSASPHKNSYMRAPPTLFGNSTAAIAASPFQPSSTSVQCTDPQPSTSGVLASLCRNVHSDRSMSKLLHKQDKTVLNALSHNRPYSCVACLPQTTSSDTGICGCRNAVGGCGVEEDERGMHGEGHASICNRASDSSRSLDSAHSSAHAASDNTVCSTLSCASATQQHTSVAVSAQKTKPSLKGLEEGKLDEPLEQKRSTRPFRNSRTRKKK
ncbi:Tyrosine-protein phosphatase non-receptor type 14 [Toxocara canis]|uniref:Tyrosine-protein phosphatase non-receptor type 14 n=1 Tax=Toxocara canis TaxID=6265 RepID=A0A0B2V179_TOXCA|nr:Tyrosine-protein phosphatase non-receptor type 14 [Toxocara canis]